MNKSNMSELNQISQLNMEDWCILVVFVKWAAGGSQGFLPESPWDRQPCEKGQGHQNWPCDSHLASCELLKLHVVQRHDCKLFCIHCDHCDLPSRQEFEFQGCQLQGPAADLLKAGASGRHLNNVKRDWFRKMGEMNYDHRMPWFFLESFAAKYFPKMGANWWKHLPCISFQTKPWVVNGIRLQSNGSMFLCGNMEKMDGMIAPSFLESQG